MIAYMTEKCFQGVYEDSCTGAFLIILSMLDVANMLLSAKMYVYIFQDDSVM